jgi:hypothetical protein
LGFDNSHGFDGAKEDDPFDHEHRPGLTGQRFQYEFISAANLFNDFWDRVQRVCDQRGVLFEFLDDE